VIPSRRVWLRELLRGLVVESLTGTACFSLAEELSRTAKACAAAAALAAARAESLGALRGRVPDAAEWFARASGTSSGQARGAMDTAAAVEEMSATREAVADGEVSLAQAAEVVRGERAVPGSEAALLETARTESLPTLRDQARDLKLGTMTHEELHARQRRAREFRHWRDPLGMVRFAGGLTPEVGVPFVNHLEADADRRRAAARRHESAELEPRAAYLADALADLVAHGGGGDKRRSRTDMVVVIDLNAYRRGHAHPGEPCHVIGGGPIPVEVAKQLSQDAFIKAVLHDGVDVHRVKHFGRHIRAELRTALDIGPAPGFEGTVCVELGCGRRHGLEIDHVDPVANHGPTALFNLEPRCWPHHQAKTERDRQAGLLGVREKARPGPRAGTRPPPSRRRE